LGDPLTAIAGRRIASVVDGIRFCQLADVTEAGILLSAIVAVWPLRFWDLVNVIEATQAALITNPRIIPPPRYRDGCRLEEDRVALAWYLS
jgi:hypothetical protein